MTATPKENTLYMHTGSYVYFRKNASGVIEKLELHAPRIFRSIIGMEIPEKEREGLVECIDAAETLMALNRNSEEWLNQAKQAGVFNKKI